MKKLPKRFYHHQHATKCEPIYGKAYISNGETMVDVIGFDRGWQDCDKEECCPKYWLLNSIRSSSHIIGITIILDKEIILEHKKELTMEFIEKYCMDDLEIYVKMRHWNNKLLIK